MKNRNFVCGGQIGVTQLRERIPQRKNRVAIPFHQFTEFANMEKPTVQSRIELKMCVVNVTTGLIAHISQRAGNPYLVAVFDTKKFLVVWRNEADSPFGVFQVSIQKIPSITITVQVILPLTGVQAENKSVFAAVGSECHLTVRGAFYNAFGLCSTECSEGSPTF